MKEVRKHWPGEASIGAWGVGRREPEEVGGCVSRWSGLGGGGTSIRHLSQIVSPYLSSLALHRAAWICTSDLGSADLSSPIEVATAQHRVRGMEINALTPHCMGSKLCFGYSTGQQANLFSAG